MTENDKKKRIKELEKIIKALDTAFHVTGDDCINPITGEVVLDNEYDALKRELLDLAPDSKIFKTVTSAESKSAKNKIIHNPPMTSINKCNGTEEEKKAILDKWFKDCGGTEPTIEDGNTFCMSYKHDGAALSCEYEKGELKRVGLRSKSGMDGIDIIEKAKYIEGIPQTLPLPVTCIIRGEAETPISTFKRINETLPEKEQKANPRAYTTGALGLKKADKIKDRGIRFTAYNILKIDNPPYKTEIERAKWAEKKLQLNYVKTIPFSMKMLETFEEQHRRLDFAVDGAVISINDLESQKELGNTGDKTTGNPRGKLAWKFKDQIKSVIVKDIIWQTGRTGNITPVLIFDGVQLEGTTVCKCTAHNLGVIKQNKLGIGSKIEIIKSGKIIPKLHKVVDTKGILYIPDKCPSCKYDLVEVEGKDGALSLACLNNDCPAQNIKNLNHWFKILGVKGISEKTIEKLVDAGLIQKPGDFYRLTVKKLLDSGFTKRTAMLIVARIWMVHSPENIKEDILLSEAIKGHSSVKIKVPLSKFFAAFGVKNSGKNVGSILEEEIGNWEKIKRIEESELSQFDGIGPVVSKEIINFFKSNKDMIEDVEQYFRFEIKPKGGKLEGKIFVLSGSLEGGKEKWRREIEIRGGTVKNSVSKKVNFLIAGEGSGSKSEKAEELGIKILNTDDLEKLLKG